MHLYLITHRTVFGNSEPLQYVAFQLPNSSSDSLYSYLCSCSSVFIFKWLQYRAVYYSIMQCSDFSKSWIPGSHTNLWQQSSDLISQMEHVMFGLRADFPNSETMEHKWFLCPCWLFVLGSTTDFKITTCVVSYC